MIFAHFQPKPVLYEKFSELTSSVDAWLVADPTYCIPRTKNSVIYLLSLCVAVMKAVPRFVKVVIVTEYKSPETSNTSGE